MIRRDQHGLALVSVLWGVAILSLIAAAMITASVTRARVAHNEWDAIRAGAVADGAVQIAILSLMDNRTDHQPRIDGTSRQIIFDGVGVTLAIQAEAGKVNVNFADVALMARLFESAGRAHDDADRLAERIFAMRTNLSPRRPFLSLDDLLTIPGISGAFLDRLEPTLTVFGTNASVDINSAPVEVLRILPDIQSLSDILKARADAFAEARQSPAAQVAPLGVPGASFTIMAKCRIASAAVSRRATVLFTGNSANPFIIQDWN